MEGGREVGGGAMSQISRWIVRGQCGGGGGGGGGQINKRKMKIFNNDIYNVGDVLSVPVSTSVSSVATHRGSGGDHKTHN